jgi:hypothetical protein
VKASLKAFVPAFCCFAAFGYFAWKVHRGGGDFQLERGYKVEIVVHGPDGKVIPIVGRAR